MITVWLAIPKLQSEEEIKEREPLPCCRCHSKHGTHLSSDSQIRPAAWDIQDPAA